MTSSGVNNIKGGPSFLFTIGNADFELNTSVILSTSGNPLCSYVFILDIYIILYIFRYV